MVVEIWWMEEALGDEEEVEQEALSTLCGGHGMKGERGVWRRSGGWWGEGGLGKTNKVGRNNSFARHSLPHDATQAVLWPSRALDVRNDTPRCTPSPAAHCRPRIGSTPTA